MSQKQKKEKMEGTTGLGRITIEQTEYTVVTVHCKTNKTHVATHSQFIYTV